MKSQDACTPIPYEMVKERFLESHPSQLDVVIVGIVVAYILLVVYGPKLMAKRRPFNLKNVITVYNIAQIFFNADLIRRYILLGGFNALLPWRNICCPISYGNDLTMDDYTRGFILARLFLINKLIDMLDTVFFILKKKNNQVTFLHAYHHLIMVVGTYYNILKSSDEMIILIAINNCFVHIVMYCYYLMSAYESMKPYLGWKKHLTRLQLAQFVYDFFLIVQFFLIAKCPEDGALVGVWIFMAISMIILFTRFYMQTYVKKKK